MSEAMIGQIHRDPHLWEFRAGRLTCQLLGDYPHGFGSSSTYPLFPQELVQQWWQGDQDQAVWAEQVHGNQVVQAEDPHRHPQADALYSQEPGVSVWVSTADCVPILLAGPGVVAAIHAGWRGTAAQITPKVISHFSKILAISPADLVMAIGPCISRAAYQVSQDVAAQVLATLPLSTHSQVSQPDPQPGKVKLDLALTNAYQALAAGVCTIAISPYCTYTHPEQFFSYRRLGSLKIGNQPSRVQWSGIALPSPPAP
jgi:YfiH family protein